jgi:hypothetical protein
MRYDQILTDIASPVPLLAAALAFAAGAISILIASARRRRHDRQIAGVTGAARPVPPGLL